MKNEIHLFCASLAPQDLLPGGPTAEQSHVLRAAVKSHFLRMSCLCASRRMNARKHGPSRIWTQQDTVVGRQPGGMHTYLWGLENGRAKGGRREIRRLVRCEERESEGAYIRPRLGHDLMKKRPAGKIIKPAAWHRIISAERIFSARPEARDVRFH